MYPLVLTGISAFLLSGLVAAAANQQRHWLRHIHFMLLALGAILLIVSGADTLLNNLDHQWQLELGLPWLHWHQRLDSLAGFFSLIIGLVTLAIACYAPQYVKEYEQGEQPFAALGIPTAIFIAAMELVVLANDAFTFMVAWELMSLSSYFLVTFQHHNSANRRAGFIYLLMAHVGGLFILIAFGILAGFARDFTFMAMAQAHPPAIWMSLTFVAALLGFGMKAGLVPIHVWLPEAHPVAPSHISALMSGVMLKVAIYGFIRLVFQLIGDVFWEWGAALLIIGCVTALYGVLYAMIQEDMKKLLAYSSIENIGIIFIGLALSSSSLAINIQNLVRLRSSLPCSIASIMPCSKACSFLVQAQFCKPVASTVLIAWAVSCGACRGQASFSCWGPSASLDFPHPMVLYRNG